MEKDSSLQLSEWEAVVPLPVPRDTNRRRKGLVGKDESSAWDMLSYRIQETPIGVFCEKQGLGSGG